MSLSRISAEQLVNRAGEDPVDLTFLAHEVFGAEEPELCGSPQVDGRDRAVGRAPSGVEPVRGGR